MLNAVDDDIIDLEIKKEASVAKGETAKVTMYEKHMQKCETFKTKIATCTTAEYTAFTELKTKGVKSHAIIEVFEAAKTNPKISKALTDGDLTKLLTNLKLEKNAGNVSEEVISIFTKLEAQKLGPDVLQGIFKNLDAIKILAKLT